MSKYWREDWQKESIVLSGTPSLPAMRASLALGRALGYEMPTDHSAHMCTAVDGSISMAAVGPDYVVMVSAAGRASTAVLQEQIGRLTFYFICTRPRILADAGQCNLADGRVSMAFDVYLDDGSKARYTGEYGAPEWLQSLEVVDGGRTVILTGSDGVSAPSDAALLAQGWFTPEPFQPSPFDLKVHYIGRARGQLAKTCALDRLEAHEKYQQVMEEVLTDEHRNREVWLVLGSGTTIDIVAAAEKGGTSAERTTEAFDAAAKQARATLSEDDRIDLTEALLINYFKPRLNVQHVNTLGLKSKVLMKARRTRLTGLNLVFETKTLGGIAMYTDEVPPQRFHIRTHCLV